MTLSVKLGTLVEPMMKLRDTFMVAFVEIPLCLAVVQLYNDMCYHLRPFFVTYIY